MVSSRLVPVGKMVRTHGLRGALKAVSYGETLGQLRPGATLYLSGDVEERGSALTVQQVRPQGKHFVIQFAEVPDIDAAQELVGREVLVSEENLPPASEGEYYHYQLIGLQVETAEGRKLGILHAIIETGSNDVYVVVHDDRELLIPAVADVILEIDLQGGRIIIAAPEGLLDDL